MTYLTTSLMKIAIVAAFAMGYIVRYLLQIWKDHGDSRKILIEGDDAKWRTLR